MDRTRLALYLRSPGAEAHLHRQRTGSKTYQWVLVPAPRRPCRPGRCIVLKRKP